MIHIDMALSNFHQKKIVLHSSFETMKVNMVIVFNMIHNIQNGFKSIYKNINDIILPERLWVLFYFDVIMRT